MRLTALALLLATPALAEDWRVLDDAGITEALAGRVLQYEGGSMQNFFPDGRTLYEVQGSESWGKWWVAGGQYCSTWPPSDVPACYGVEVLRLDVRFTSKAGGVSVGRYVEL
jgi:hypothetical protein